MTLFLPKMTFAVLIVVHSSLVLAAPPEYCDHLDLLTWIDESGTVHPVDSPRDWNRRRSHILQHMQQVMGELPKPGEPVPLNPQIISEKQQGAISLKKVAYHTDSPMAQVRAWLLLPRMDSEQRVPAVLCLHQTSPRGKDEPAGVRGDSQLGYAKELAELGFVALAPDYPSFGEYEYDFDNDDYVSGTMKAIYDNIRAIDFLTSLPEVDPERIGVIGHSLGGHNAIFTAVFDDRLKAIVTSCAFTRFHNYYEGDLTGWTSSRYMPRIATLYNSDPDKVPFDFPELIAALAPRAMLAVAPLEDHNFDVAGVKDTMSAAASIYALHGAEERLMALYPDTGHEFPLPFRNKSYQFLVKFLSQD